MYKNAHLQNITAGPERHIEEREEGELKLARENTGEQVCVVCSTDGLNYEDSSPNEAVFLPKNQQH